MTEPTPADVRLTSIPMWESYSGLVVTSETVKRHLATLLATRPGLVGLSGAVRGGRPLLPAEAFKPGVKVLEIDNPKVDRIRMLLLQARNDECSVDLWFNGFGGTFSVQLS